MKEIIIDGLESLPSAAAEFLKQTEGRRHIAFHAGMGAGKTTFITEICRQLGVEDLVTSPTFTIVNEYRDRNGDSIYHFDLYRINKESELYDIGIEEYLDSDCLCLFEWPENAGDTLPEDTMHISIKVDENGRRILRETDGTAI